MSMQKIISKKKLCECLNSLSKDYQIIGPKELANKGIFYMPVNTAEELCLTDAFAIEPAKKFFLEPSQWLFKNKFESGKDSIEEETALSENKRIIIGIRPCEARGLTLLDKVFDSEYKDSAYIKNRQRSVIIGFACSKPDKSCFCTSMGSSPLDTDGMDAIIYKCEDKFVVEFITAKAQELFGSLGDELSLDEKKSLEYDKARIKTSLQKKIVVPEDLDKIFENAYWDEVSSSCLSCGICTYLCPTCHCFDLVDEERRRLRCYDGCSFRDFTLETSGENPRPTKKERYRQRVLHKFNYFKKNFGVNLCVGCGRCIRHCPVKIDIAEIVDKAPIAS